MKSGENYNSGRRSFFKQLGTALLVLPMLQACQKQLKNLAVKLTGTNHVLGHRLWAKNFPKPSRQIKVPYLIVGGGISGLSAARQFRKKGIEDFLMIELENHLGGNSSNGENAFSKYPWGAHYLPLPNMDDKELIKFLEEEKIILGYDAKGFPKFDEEQLTFDPHERLFHKNIWQESLVPKIGNSKNDDSEFIRFFETMEKFRFQKDDQGKYWFDIPLTLSSQNEKAKVLDKISMEQWLQENHFNSKPLFDYVNYCCRDDFGLGIQNISAWAGIHYFAGRKQNASEEKSDSVLTWPEGNSRLTTHLKKYVRDKSLKNHLVYEVEINKNQVSVKAFDNNSKTSVEIIADRVVMATPQFINQYLIKDRKDFSKDFHYAPWLLATLVINDLSDNNSYPLCWDNVIYGAKGLGYIYDQHQNIQQLQPKKVITYYYSFSNSDIKKSRKDLYQKGEEHWKKMVFDDLKLAHPNIESETENIEIRLLGHGMISPVPGFIFSKSKQQASQTIDNKIYFAHSDLSGISIFEEAFHQGINAVNKLLDETTLDT